MGFEKFYPQKIVLMIMKILKSLFNNLSYPKELNWNLEMNLSSNIFKI